MTAQWRTEGAPSAHGHAGQDADGEQAALLRAGMEGLRRTDPELALLLDAEVRSQNATLAMIASASIADPSVLAAGGAALSNVTAEGYPGNRYHPGAARFDEIERIAVERAKELFGAAYANVQPHSCSSANLAVLSALIPPGGTLLGLDLDAGGHLTHGSPASVTGRHFHAVHYGLDAAGRIDFGQVAALTAEHRPQVIIAGASAYPRTVDFERFRAIADTVGAYLLADISHIAGLVAAGEHPSPVDVAHLTTTSTYKQLGGPRGGLILSGEEHRTPGPDGRTPLSRLMQRAVFPQSQGTPSPAAIAAKARAFALAAGPEFRETARLTVTGAAALADELAELGHRVLTGGTDNHMVLLDIGEYGLTGVVAERALEECGILANRNRIPGDTKPPLVTSGLRLGTNILAQRGMGPDQARRCAHLVHAVLNATVPLGDTEYRIDPERAAGFRAEVRELCARHPLPLQSRESSLAPLIGAGQ
ncbi:serine hydroxymethyltransferase [Streptomyces griseomycini]|uniref:Probable serine hydroxymethyltransferase n=2 Tax=Streptomyces griseomycini TaxID=66895 RepID=A0A7W7PYK4_9ACTN|nr:serine hydroxymethyltransferase [Streptomyces griseomycini]MBB4903684.1 glycine hydroxymethyltransferase [Streptomyces griseomycini]GGQ39148.1 serine hydroxymethyltransferase [Streptomyces griseomycini]GGR60303.1 serine hydroxymethyltransferase [Streptomyces griseomycini]